ncbi:MAG TPA: type I glutamate--ammonia ligase [Methanosarcinales archaeon]|nr:type I glutamate--ammonia ligase [Methanosarcinales archaeon]
MITTDSILGMIGERNIKFVRLQFVDILGIIKNVAIPASQMEKALDVGISFDGSSIEGFARIQESDMVLKPDPETFRILPWDANGGRVAGIVCDVHLHDGAQFPGCPRGVLKRAEKEAEKMGYVMNIGPELEFFLFEKEDGLPTTIPHDSGGYFDFPPVDLAEDIRRDIVIALEEMDFEIEASHHEVAHGQHEIDFKYSDALSTADKVVTFKYVTKTIATNKDLHATFMPKPVFGASGSGMHINISLFNKNNENIFYDINGDHEISDHARHFIGGLLTHIRAVTAITNPLVNSYKRLVSGYEAPVYITWSWANRSSLIRVPAARGMGTRIELRSPDPSCNPYLSFAAILMAGLDGIKNKIDPGAPIEENIYEMDSHRIMDAGIDTLPTSLSLALDHLESDAVVRRALGEHAYSAFMRIATGEWDAYRTQVHQWELDRYLQLF